MKTILFPLSLALALSACVGTPTMTASIDSALPHYLETVHRESDDLLTAGLGLEGLQSMTPPPVQDSAHPRPEELRRRAIWSNWRGIADLRPGEGAVKHLPTIPGREFSTWLTVPGARHPHRVVVQLPDNFNPKAPCLVVAPASGSRGVYGAIAVSAPWALPKGCAVVYTDKGAGTDYYDYPAARGVALDGTLTLDRAAMAFAPAAPSGQGVAFKHAHSQDNPEADWGEHVRQAARFGLQILQEVFPQHRPFNAASTRIIAVGISNGGGAVLRAAEATDDLLDAVVAGEPNVYVEAPGSRALYDYATLAARLVPCAVLAMEDLPSPPMGEALQTQGKWWCQTLAQQGELSGNSPNDQARDALAQLRAAGFTDHALRSGTTTTGFDLWRAVAAPYASAYGRFAAGEHPCGYDYQWLDSTGTTGTPPDNVRATWWSDASGIPPGNGIALIDRLGLEHGGRPDTGLTCLRALWTDDTAAAKRVQAGVAETRATLPREGLPVMIVHGQDDGLIPPAFSSVPYVNLARASGRLVRYWEIPRAQHFDAFLAFPDYARRYVPLLPSVHAALDAVWAHLENPEHPLPEHQP